MLSSELDADRNPVRGYVYGNEYISQNNGSSSGYYLNDEQGSIRYLTGSDGSIRNHYRYSAFGESITAEETVPNRLKYNAQMADELTGLYYLRARYYNASLGRFTQEDVIYNDGLNLYAYCNSNPVMYSDPSGFAKETCKSKVGGECDSESGRNTATTINYSYKFDRELANFNDGYEIRTTVDKDLILVQYSSDAPDASLCYWTTVDEANRITTLNDYMDKLALSKDWGNRNTVKVARIPAGIEVKYAVGTAREQLLIADPRPGGGVQYLFNQFDTDWITEIRSFSN